MKHTDEAMDKKLIKQMVKAETLKHLKVNTEKHVKMHVGKHVDKHLKIRAKASK